MKAPRIAVSVSLLVASTSIASAQSDDTIYVSDRAADRSIDCNNKPINISGQANDVALKNCPDVTVSGQSNDVWIEAPETVRISGESNDVMITFKNGGQLLITGRSNDVILSGSGYSVSNRGQNNEVTRQ